MQNDLISRSALIEKLREKIKQKPPTSILRIVFLEVIKIVENQPTDYNVEKVIEQLEEKSNDIPLQYESNYEQGYADGIDYAIKIIRNGGNTDAPEINVGNNGWIPVSERLPEEEEKRQAYCRNHHGSEFVVMIDEASRPTTLYLTMDGFWVDDKRAVYKVIAWQPLPEPYTGEKQ